MILVKTLDSPIFSKEKNLAITFFLFKLDTLFENNLNLGTSIILLFTQFV